MKKIICVEFGCEYPEGECVGLCRRNQALGSNGNDGAHYRDCPPNAPAAPTGLPTPDMVNHPPHYTRGSVECIDAIEAALTPEEFKGYCKAAAIKYLWRLDHKGSAKENAEKAIWYLQRLVKVL